MADGAVFMKGLAMSDIKKRIENLPVKPKDLQRWILVGKVKLKAQIDAIRAISKLDDGIAAHAGALSDTQDLAEELLYAESRLGGLYDEVESEQGKRTDVLCSSKGTKLDKIEPNRKQRHFAKELHNNEEIIAKVVAEAREKGEVPVRQHVLNKIKQPHVSFNSGENEWYTPNEYIEAARKVMGSIDTDPATTASANKRIGAKTFYTIENTGLGKGWKGNVWMNPPYSQPLVAHFCDTFAHKFRSKEIKQGCVLINNITETRFAQRLMEISSAICFPAGRVRFLDTNFENAGAPLQGQMVIYCGNNTDSFVKEFSCLGICLRNVDK